MNQEMQVILAAKDGIELHKVADKINYYSKACTPRISNVISGNGDYSSTSVSLEIMLNMSFVQLYLSLR